MCWTACSKPIKQVSPVRPRVKSHRRATKISRRTQKQLKACSLFGSLIEVLKSCQNEVMVGPNIFMRLVPQGKPHSFAGYPGSLRKRQLMLHAVIEIANRRGRLAALNGIIHQFGDRFEKTLSAATGLNLTCGDFLETPFRPDQTIGDHRLGLVKLTNRKIRVARERHDLREVEISLALINNCGKQERPASFFTR